MVLVTKAEISDNKPRSIEHAKSSALDSVTMKKIAIGKLTESDAEIAMKNLLREGSMSTAGIVADFLGLQEITRIRLGILGAREKWMRYTILSVALFRAGNSNTTAERKEKEVVECLKLQFRYAGKEGVLRLKESVKSRMSDTVERITASVDEDRSKKVKHLVLKALEILNSEEIERKIK